MKEQEAEHQGLRFTGIYDRSREQIKARIAQERLKHPEARIIIVTVPDSKLSRGGGGTGYSIYADEIYFLQDRTAELKQELGQYARHVSIMKARHQNELDSMEAANEKFQRELFEKQGRLNDLIRCGMTAQT